MNGVFVPYIVFYNSHVSVRVDEGRKGRVVVVTVRLIGYRSAVCPAIHLSPVYCDAEISMLYLFTVTVCIRSPVNNSPGESDGSRVLCPCDALLQGL